MDVQNLGLLPNHRVVLEGFIKACERDERVTVALIVGSYVKGLPDKHSDLDLYVITTDDSYKDFTANRSAFIERLGEPLFMENFDQSDFVFLIFADGSEVEISFGRESQLTKIFNEPFKALLDKKNLTSGIVPRERDSDDEEQKEKLRRLIYWFWHELSHFTTALARGQLWWAQGQLNALRLHCINLTRLQNDFSDQEIGEEGYFKIEKAIPIEQLLVLEGTYCPMEKEAMLEAALLILRFFRDLAPGLASKHGITYPERLDHVIVAKLENLRNDIEHE
jgi:predicted nucleotidyltransferase